ncbi:MAG TPA: hypothetical protein VFO36_11970 [Nitrospiraceae bacterium]|nr:hypothetical protein [Nitrospiraceae bacterium]
MRISRYPEFVSERLSAVENIQRTWTVTAIIVGNVAHPVSLSSKQEGNVS